MSAAAISPKPRYPSAFSLPSVIPGNATKKTWYAKIDIPIAPIQPKSSRKLTSPVRSS